MLDWEGSVVKEFGYTKGVANIYVIDRSGRIVQQVTGAMREAAARELFDQIDRVLENPSQK
jgi:N-acetylmuramic acid 6-phosphate (MurNAc-6-P) etherase